MQEDVSIKENLMEVTGENFMKKRGFQKKFKVYKINQKIIKQIWI